MKRRIAAAAITAAALTVTTPARAAVDLGPGASPRLAMDRNGTAHIVFSNDAGAVYCRLPRGARHCDVRVAMPLGDSSGPAYIVRRPSDGALFVVQSNAPLPDDLTWVRVSLDHGATWSAPHVIGADNGLLGLDDVQLSADGGSLLTLMTDFGSGATLQWGPIAGVEGRVFNFTQTGTGNDNARIAVLRDGRVLAVAETVTSRLLWRVFGGGDPYSQAAWRPSPGQRLPDGYSPRVATGRRGTYVMTTRSPDAQLLHGRAAFRVRALRGGHLTRGRTFGGDARIAGTNVSEALFEDARGRLHAAWTTTGGSRMCLVYARTTASRRSWFGAPTTLFLTRLNSRPPDDVHIAATRNGRGLAVWQDSRFGTAKVDHIRATALRQKRGRPRFIRNPFDRPDCPRG
ncbi:MAG TPA: hypothetical protein VH418_08965 [Solirubrobacteraceae bacterium]